MDPFSEILIYCFFTTSIPQTSHSASNADIGGARFTAPGFKLQAREVQPRKAGHIRDAEG